MDSNVIVKKSLDIMTQLRDSCNESVGLAILVHKEALGKAIARVEGEQGVSIRFDVGFTFPPHIGAPTKAILAYLPVEERDEFINKMTFEGFTDSTITDRDTFIKELELTKKRGYSTDVGEHNAGCNCVGASIFDESHYPIAAIWTSSFSNRMMPSRFEEVAEKVIASAKLISSRMQGKGNTQADYTQLVIQEAQSYFHDNLDRKFDIKEYAESVNVGYSWFRSRFKEVVGQSPKQYHHQICMDKAVDLLLHTDLSVKEISHSLGYESQNYFSSAFKNITSRNPSDYREK
ncbi:MAG: helix-turn-helix domain-containing protein [Planctomycetes bacterium]|nr:helix-turn-helix domain-containing protein [Planctomycetota bacterium]